MYGTDFNNESHHDAASTVATMLMLLIGFTLSLSVLAKLAQRAEANNRLDYDSPFARRLAGALLFIVNMLHTTKNDMEIPDGANALIAIGPHRTGWEALVVASKMKGAPPRFLATSNYNAVPGVYSFLKMFKAISVEPGVAKNSPGRTVNALAMDEASRELENKGCVALFPQGDFARINQDPPLIYPGIARLALRNKIPVHVIRLDGFNCLENSWIPLVIRNNSYYRAFLSLAHRNNIRTTLCGVIDFHLQAENADLPEEEKIQEICAQLYAWYHQTRELSREEIAGIREQIDNKKHQPFWANRTKQEHLRKQILTLKEEAQLMEKDLRPATF